MKQPNTKECGAGLADTVWDITINTRFGYRNQQISKSANCRVMLGGEIYYRAIGRPWGPATYCSTVTEAGVAIGPAKDFK